MKSRGNLKLFYVTIYTHFVASNWRRDCKTVIKTERKRATKSKMADSFPFSITIIVKSKKYWLYRKSRILVDPESHLVSEKRYFCQISDTFKKKKKRDRSVLSEADRERGDYFIIVQSRSLGCEKQERGRSCKGEESRFIRFSNLVHQAGCIPSNRVRQIYRGIMQIMHVCPPLSSSSPAISSRRVEKRGVARYEKVNRKVNFRPRPLYTGHFHSIRPPNASFRDGSRIVCPLVCTL